ncbi:MAG: hypothetical protein ABIW38_00455 [Ferruginibacter sp.]
MKGQGKKITIVVFILLGIAASIGFYLYNKGPVNIKNANAIKINANELYNDFITDSASAQKKYTGKVLSVNAKVSSSTVNQNGEQLILLNTALQSAFINCTFEEKDVKIIAGEQVTIKGLCSGIGQGDIDLGIAGDVYLSRCYLLKNTP